MRDCDNGEVRDLLPDLLHDRLNPAARAEVQRHVDACDDCRAELELLRRVLAVTPTPAVDVARIAAAVPAYRRRARLSGSARAWALRAAAVVAMIAGGWGVLRVASGTATSGGPPTPAVAVLPPPVVSPVPATPRSAPNDSTRVPAPRPVTELALGESFHDLSDRELQALLDELGSLDAMTPAETEEVVPAIDRSGR